MVDSQVSLAETGVKEEVVPGQRRDPYRITKERLANSNARLTSLFFHRGGNVYVFTYQKEGTFKHTFIDSGDPRHRDQILAILNENGIIPDNIEKIIITHRHVDHSGLADVLAGASNAKILVHANFQSFIEGEMDSMERSWFGGFDASGLKKHDLIYLRQSDSAASVSISGVSFPILAEPINIDGDGRLFILGCPDSITTHSPDQVIVMYSAVPDPFRQEDHQGNYLPTDNIIFAGDLWLMQGPFHHLGISDIPRLLRFGVRSVFIGRHHRNHREQDASAKEALKRSFCLVRVKPGHGDEFVGSRIIPNGLLADRDILLELGYEAGTDKSILRRKDMAARVAAIKDQAFSRFVTELGSWLEMGYTSDAASQLLVRIYREQSGGNRLVRNDRKQRRIRLKNSLYRLSRDTNQNEVLRRLAVSALAMIKKSR